MQLSTVPTYSYTNATGRQQRLSQVIKMYPYMQLYLEHVQVILKHKGKCTIHEEGKIKVAILLRRQAVPDAPPI